MKKVLYPFLPLLLLLFAAASLLSACASREEPPQQALDEQLFFGQQLQLEDGEEQPYSSISITVEEALYSQLAAGQKPGEEALCQKLSQALAQIAGDYIAACQAEDDAQRQADPDYEASHRMGISLFYAGAELISIKAELYENVNGAAHSLQRFRGYNFDRGGNALPLSTLLGSDPQEAVFPVILQQVEEKGELLNYYPDLEQLLQSCFAEDKWCADGEQIYLFYDPYDISSYALGGQEFKLPR